MFRASFYFVDQNKNLAKYLKHYLIKIQCLSKSVQLSEHIRNHKVGVTQITLHK